MAAKDFGLKEISPRELAEQYIRETAPLFEIDAGVLKGFDRAPADGLTDETDELRFEGEKSVMETEVVSFSQTYFNLPVWRAGITVRMAGKPLAVTTSQSSLHYDVRAQMPAPDSQYLPERMTPEILARVLGLAGVKEFPVINSVRLIIYRYVPSDRVAPDEPEGESGSTETSPPRLPISDVLDVIEPGRHYVVTEVMFSFPVHGWGNLNWRAFIEPETGAVLYLRALVATCTGMVYVRDPLTATGDTTITSSSPAADLDPLRTAVRLRGINPPPKPEDPTELAGELVEVRDLLSPTAAPPTSVGGNFTYTVPSRDFAAVNAYHHCDEFFRMLERMGFDLPTYFDGTSFPVSVDHWGWTAQSGDVNAACHGNAQSNGIGWLVFGRAQASTQVGIAADRRIVLHEFGHGLLWDHVDFPNFGFSHSAGDSMAVILLDPDSNAPDRFDTFPWSPIRRRHDRDIADGWAWGGTHDDRRYRSEQILSTTMFRLYRSTGGDSSLLGVRRCAARYAVYLIVRAIGTLTHDSNPDDAEDFAAALMDADEHTAMLGTLRGGCVHKVIRWSFEQQGAYQPPGAPTPVAAPGSPPDVDVYIDDGRNGVYTPFLENFWATEEIWNRLSPDGGLVHQTPLVGVTNYAYVRVRNRGTQQANNVVIRGYRSRPAVGLVWPDDFKPMTTKELSLSGGLGSGGETIVGPFNWTPDVTGHELMLMTVSADGDLSNTETVLSYAPVNRLIPFDNNIALRCKIPVPGGGEAANLAAAFNGQRFWVNNPYDRAVNAVVSAALPQFLVDRGWEAVFQNPEGGSFSLWAKDSREVRPALKAGADFTTADVQAAGASCAIEIRTLLNDVPVGGLTYSLDTNLSAPAE